jgi:anthranilate synthase component 2
MRVLIFDNYDSFTYNLVHLVEHILRTPVTVKRNDEISIEEAADFDRIILSPGPGIPSEAGLLLDLIRAHASNIPMLGVCLGHQAIGEVFGGSLHNLAQVYHGLSRPLHMTDSNHFLFQGMPDLPMVGRYHSWVVDRASLPDCLHVIAEDDQGYIMAMQHQSFPVTGVQFHPESVLTPQGEILMRNWLLHHPQA